MKGLEALKELLKDPKKIAIISHRNPDGDAIGSSLGLYHFLKKHDHEPVVLFPSEFPEFVGWLPDSEHILIYDNDKEKVEGVLKEAEIIFCLDFNALHRVDHIGEYIRKNCGETFKVLIDHHLEPEDFAQFTLSNIKASSTCELVYEFILLMEKELNINFC